MLPFWLSINRNALHFSILLNAMHLVPYVYLVQVCIRFLRQYKIDPKSIKDLTLKTVNVNRMCDMSSVSVVYDLIYFPFNL